jgi:hypothetical protein
MRRSSANAPQGAGAAPTEGGSEHSVEKSADPFELQHLERPRRTTRPGTRTLVDDNRATTGIPSSRTCARQRCASFQSQSRSTRGDWMSVSRPHSAAFAAHHDAPLIGARAQRGCVATEGGGEPRRREEALSFVFQPRESDRAARASTRWRLPKPILRLRRRHDAPRIGERGATRGQRNGGWR